MKMSTNHLILVIVLVWSAGKTGGNDTEELPVESPETEETTEYEVKPNNGATVLTTAKIETVSTTTISGTSTKDLRTENIPSASTKTVPGKGDREVTRTSDHMHLSHDGTSHIPATTENIRIERDTNSGSGIKNSENRNSEITNPKESPTTNGRTEQEVKKTSASDKVNKNNNQTRNSKNGKKDKEQINKLTDRSQEKEVKNCSGDGMEKAESNPQSKVESINVSTVLPSTEIQNPSTTATTVSTTVKTNPTNTLNNTSKRITWKKVLNVIGSVLTVFTVIGGAFYMVYSII